MGEGAALRCLTHIHICKTGSLRRLVWNKVSQTETDILIEHT